MKNARVLARFTTLLAMVTVLAPAGANAADSLRWKFSKGQKLNYTVTQLTAVKADIKGQAFETKIDQVMEMTWEVKDVDSSGTAQMDQTIDRIVYTMKAGGGVAVEIDTKKESAPEGPSAKLAAMFRGMTGSPTALKMSARGEVSDVKVSPKMVAAIQNSGAPAGATDAFSEKGLRDLMTQATIVFPEKALSRGDTWNQTKNVNMPFGTMVLDNTYTYEGPSDRTDKIGVAVKIAIEPKEDSPIAIKVASQDSKGVFHFDSNAGILRGSELTQKMRLQLKVADGELMQDVESTVKMEQAPKSPK